MALKHVGRMAQSGKKVLVAYRVLPNDAENCLVIATESLDADQHDSLMKLVESNVGQSAYELAEAMARVTLPDGRNMLAGLHMYGKLTKVPTKDVEMIPDTKSVINLAELNKIIAEQKGVTVEDLAVQPASTAKKSTNNAPVEDTVVVDPVQTTVVPQVQEPLTDDALAGQYRSQADALYKEAKRLREMAEELAPTKRKTKASATES
jgi:hypothetical protein